MTMHVIDTARGCNAAAIAVRVARREKDGWVQVKSARLTDSGRTDPPLLPRGEFVPGEYEFTLDAPEYFARVHLATYERPAYVGEVILRLHLVDGSAHYHVPVALSPWGYTTFRGG